MLTVRRADETGTAKVGRTEEVGEGKQTACGLLEVQWATWGSGPTPTPLQAARWQRRRPGY
jgi:hypothetical protein